MLGREVHTNFCAVLVWEMQEPQKKTASVKKCSDYYPFGLTMPGRSANIANPNDNYKFTGHERDDEANLTLDYMMARNYDPIIGRFLQIDPLAIKMPAWSAYNYSFNNPLNFIDPSGKIPWPVARFYFTSNNYFVGRRYQRGITSGFYRNYNSSLKHGAADISFRADININKSVGGANVVATHDGTISIIQKNNETAGNWVVVQNGDLLTRYLHLGSLADLKVGDTVNEGDFLGTVGNTGKSNGHHLHYEIQLKNADGKWEKINPFVGDPKQITEFGSDIALKDPQKMLGLPSKDEQNNSGSLIDLVNSLFKLLEQTGGDMIRYENN